MKIAVVTGASSGIGKEFVLQLSKQSNVDEIWAVARRTERLRELSEQCETAVIPISADLTKAEDIEKFSELFLLKKPELVMLINCAGYGKFGSFGSIEPSDEISMIELDVLALVKITQMAVPYMKHGGKIIQIASTAAFQPLPDMNVYAASKAFVLSYSRALNIELKPRKISVTAVCPGATETEFFEVAQKGADNGSVHSFSSMAKPQDVVKKAIKDANCGKDVSVFGAYNNAHRFFAKILPVSLVMKAWKHMK